MDEETTWTELTQEQVLAIFESDTLRVYDVTEDLTGHTEVEIPSDWKARGVYFLGAYCDDVGMYHTILDQEAFASASWELEHDGYGCCLRAILPSERVAWEGRVIEDPSVARVMNLITDNKK